MQVRAARALRELTRDRKAAPPPHAVEGARPRDTIAQPPPQAPVTADWLERVRDEQVRRLYAEDGRVALASMAVAVAVAGLFHVHQPDGKALAWGAVLVVLLAARVVYVGVRRRRIAPGADARRALREYLVPLGASALAWSIGPFLFFPDQPGYQALLISIWIALATAATPMVAVSRFAIYLWLVPLLLPLAARFLTAADPTTNVLGMIAAVVLVVQLRLALEQNELLTATLLARLQNEDLVARLREQMNLVARASEDKTRFLAAAAHDLRQPLHALGLFCAALDQRLRDIPEKPLVRSMMKSIEALESSFGAILDISRLDSGAVQPNVQVFPVRDVFRRLYMHYAGDAEIADISLRFRAAGRLVRSDAQLLERIVSNLIQNSLRYTRTGGVLVAARRRAGQVSIEVWDSGIGIPADKLDLIFQEFYQIDNPERDRSKGLGMGLAIVRRLSDLLGHRLEVRSTPGRGSVFRLLVPSAIEGAPDAAQLGADTLPPRIERHVTLLLIDDERAIRDAMSELLTPLHVDVLAAATVEEACRIAQVTRQPIDLILSDWRLRGDEDGIEAVRRVRRLTGATTPAVLITGETSPEIVKLAHASGLVVMYKPLQPKELLRLITPLSR
ncbi:MAG TPA: hybrid sensor histidine kinase/response regulator [Burkholderiaceae bacterium]|nr:hybrid sensor histidine kinase/response regulator [Burkholderiaceae bacterium]